MFDHELRLKDRGLVSSSGYGTVGGEATVLDLGRGLVVGSLVLDVYKLDIEDNDELYRLHLMGGEDESFTNEVSLCSLELGAKEVVEGTEDSARARYVLPFSNEQAGTVYRFLRIRHEISGSSPLINYAATLTHLHGLRGTTNIALTTTTTTSTTSTTTTTT
jgi:hypothetical protein